MSETIQTIPNIPEQRISQYGVLERLGLPRGFVTEKGSQYAYTDNGRVKRQKYDGTNHEQGIAVFLPNNSEGDSMAIRIRNSLDESVPSPHRLAVRIVERVVDDSTGEVVGKYRTSTADIENPDNVGVVLIGDGRVVDGVGVSVIPELGTRVLEMDTLPNGSVNVHPGHRVISVVT